MAYLVKILFWLFWSFPGGRLGKKPNRPPGNLVFGPFLKNTHKICLYFCQNLKIVAVDKVFVVAYLVKILFRLLWSFPGGRLGKKSNRPPGNEVFQPNSPAENQVAPSNHMALRQIAIRRIQSININLIAS